MKNNIVDLVKQLRIKADMISMGEKIMWGDDTRLMYQAADTLTTLTQHHQDEIAILKAKLAEYEQSA